MKPIRPLLATGLLLLAGCSSLPPRDSDLDAVLAASGTDAELAMLAHPLPHDRLTGAMSLIPEDWITAINATVEDNLKPAEWRAQLRSGLQQQMSSRELADVQHFYESPAGRAVVASESGRGNAAAVGGNDAATLEALANATGLGKAAAKLAEKGLGDAFDVALRTNCFGQGETRFAGLVGGVLKKAQLNAVRRAVGEQVQARYASLTPAEREEYLAFTQSSAGQKFLRVRSETLSNAADKAGTALGTELTPRFKAFCRESN